MNRTSPLAVAIFFLSAAVATAATAQTTKEEIASRLNNVKAEDISDSPLPGVYQVQVGSRVAYISQDGRYLLQGDLYDLETSRNLTEATRAGSRVEMLAEVPEDQMMIFAAADGEPKHTITIFTDIDCGYCRQFHREIEQVNALGIEVHYLFYPRTGPNTDSWAKAEKVWCIGPDERNAALTQAKLGGKVPEETCDTNPVGAHWQLGHDIGVTGTPSVIAANGEVIGGYLAPDQLLDRLENLAQ
ncbi:MAG: DsbC family protein [Gammaproteobacteria bacterium]